MNTTHYEAVIGLEVHAELATKSKLFCACSTEFGAPPNTLCCPICMGYPGTLPTWNRRAIELAAKAGLALNATVNEISYADRKQYFYPDLPKAYQISQGAHPICSDGYLDFSVNGEEKRVHITRIHIEEDAGKLIHQGDKTLLDGNRCGVPLIEIVSAPELRSGAEAAAYLKALRAVLIAAGVSDCKMQEGSMRCDVNVSVRTVGDPTFGIRTELKNINSFSFVEKAIAYEVKRQIALLERGEQIRMETRRFDSQSGETVLMRIKEQAEDYRFLFETNLPPIMLTKELIEKWKTELPELPAARKHRLVSQFGLPEKEVGVLCNDAELGDYFERAAAMSAYPKLLLNLLLGDLLRYCTTDPFFSPVREERLAEIAELLGEGTVNSSTAKKLLARLTESDFSPRETVDKEGLAQIRDRALLTEWIEEILLQSPRAVADYKNGKTNAIRALQGKLMAKSQGRAEPILAERLLLEALSKEK